MNRSTGRITRSTAKRFQALPKVYKDAFTGASIIVTPSATGKGIHMRWQYPELVPDDQETIQIGHLSATSPLARELALHIDDNEYADLFDGSLSSIDSDPSFQNLESDAVSDAFASLFEGSLSSLSSTPSDEGLNDATVMEDSDAEEPTRAPRIATRIHQLPDRIILRPDDFSEAAKFRRMMKEEQRIEETFCAQWQKMVEQRQMALHTIKSWMKKGKAKCGTPGDESTEDERADHRMDVDGKSRNAIMCTPNGATPMITRGACSGPDRRQKGEHRDGAARHRQLGPCGTIIIKNPHQIWDGTSTAPPYPQEWISRRLAGQESTEILQNALI